jgi:integrase
MLIPVGGKLGHVSIVGKHIRGELMPDYTRSDVEHIIDLDEFKALFNHCNTLREKSWISLLWLTGARPSELLSMKRSNIIFEENKIHFKIETKKLKKDGKFFVEKRNLVLNIPDENRFILAIYKYVRMLKSDDSKLFQFSRRTGYNIIERLGYNALGISLCPYNFRHSRLTLLAESGASEEKLMKFKGSRTRSSVRPYLHARKVDYEVEIDL